MMVGGILITIVLFVVAIALCMTTNLMVFRYMWNNAPAWLQLAAYVVCTFVIMVTLYHVVGYVWGVD